MSELPPDALHRLHQANRAAWDEAAARYADEVDRDIAFLRAGGVALQRPEWPYLHELAAWCSRAIHLQCAGGLDTLSLWNHGATEVVGVDISARMLAGAEAKAAAIGAAARWYCCDVLDTPADLDASADLVYTGKGALLWLMDLRRWAEVVERLLKPNGRLYVFEGHPLTWVWDPSAATYQLDPDPRYGDYFSSTIAQDQGWPTAYMPEASVPPREQQARKFERQWTLGYVVTVLAEAGLRLERLEV